MIAFVQTGKLGDVVVPLVITAIAASVVVPLPTPLLDFLIAGNLVLSVVLLASALTSRRILDISSFPTMVLLATLYRLALNISSTRIILSDLKVGEIVTVVGGLITEGDVFVGIVVFLVISLIQFIVIAKGAERVAEVSARFSLDAMPGKQMSIDSELRSGILSVREAKIARRELEQESRFYGALDGAMKFVKGDAIAGVLIVIVNLFGSLFVAFSRRGLDMERAFKSSAFITVGDGLVAQIPALFTALAAGVVVTRVGGESSSASDIFEQLMKSVGIQLSVGVLCFFLGVFPGMPHLAFFTFGAIFCVVACLNSSMSKQDSEQNAKAENVVVPVLELSLPMELFQDEQRRDFVQAFESMREQLFRGFGLLIPKPVLSHAEGRQVSIYLRGDECARFSWQADQGAKDLARTIMERLGSVGEEFVDDVFTQALLGRYESFRPELVVRLVPELCSVTTITRVLRTLVADGIPIRNFDTILQTLAEVIPALRDNLVEVIESVRLALSRSICASLSVEEGGAIRVLRVSPQFEFQCYKAFNEEEVLPSALWDDFSQFLLSFSDKAHILEVSGVSRRALASYVGAAGFGIRVFASEELRHLCKEEVAKFTPLLGHQLELAA